MPLPDRQVINGIVMILDCVDGLYVISVTSSRMMVDRTFTAYDECLRCYNDLIQIVIDGCV